MESNIHPDEARSVAGRRHEGKAVVAPLRTVKRVLTVACITTAEMMTEECAVSCTGATAVCWGVCSMG